MKTKLNNANKGMTLTELLTAMAMFSIIIGAISGVFISAIRSQIRVFAVQEIVDQTSYALEYISRQLRMAGKELNCIDREDISSCDCLNTEGYGANYENPNDDTSAIRFLDYDGRCRQFLLEDNQIKEQISDDHKAVSFQDPVPLSSTSISIKNLEFKISGEHQPQIPIGLEDYFQPRVTIALGVESTKSTSPPVMQIQTSVSQRPLDIVESF